jgi:hypothetical protein
MRGAILSLQLKSMGLLIPPDGWFSAGRFSFSMRIPPLIVTPLAIDQESWKKKEWLLLETCPLEPKS